MRTSKNLRVAFSALATMGLLGTGMLGASASAEMPTSPLAMNSQESSTNVLVASDGSTSPASASTRAVKDCVGHYKSGDAPCQAGRVAAGVQTSHKECSTKGNHLLSTVHKMTGAGYRVGYYTYECVALSGAAQGDYMLRMVGFVKVYDTNATHS